ncbi:hypothetical protein BRADI_3g39260v3 [Brachypodium distachyon]|uniref:Uncharacterized protein n=1 Tax=Brachypodium distachyon TaxID=15368 RepID=I1I881_BRADI|nr:hypothetical protein BRADI_3g39260v3 [Brachypodium distachyon]
MDQAADSSAPTAEAPAVEAPAPEVTEDAAAEEPSPWAAAAAMVLEIPPGVFEFPWLECRGGLGVPSGGNGAAVTELRDVFFRSLVDGSSPAVGVQWDRLFAPPRKGAIFEHVEAWLATSAAHRELQHDPIWRAVLLADRPNNPKPEPKPAAAA